MSTNGNGKPDPKPYTDAVRLVEIWRRTNAIQDELTALGKEEEAILARWWRSIGDWRGEVELYGTGERYLLTVYEGKQYADYDVDRLVAAWTLPDDYPAPKPEPDEEWSEDDRVELTRLGWATAIPHGASAVVEGE